MKSWNRVEFEIWSLACLIMNDAAKAEEVLEQGLQEYPDDSDLVDQLSNFCLTSGRQSAARASDPQEQLGLLVRAFQLKPDDEQAIIRLSERACRRRYRPEAQQAIQESAAAESRLPSVSMPSWEPKRPNEATILRPSSTCEQACNRIPKMRSP